MITVCFCNMQYATTTNRVLIKCVPYASIIVDIFADIPIHASKCLTLFSAFYLPAVYCLVALPQKLVCNLFNIAGYHVGRRRSFAVQPGIPGLQVQHWLSSAAQLYSLCRLRFLFADTETAHYSYRTGAAHGYRRLGLLFKQYLLRVRRGV